MRNVFEARVIVRADGNRGLAWNAMELECAVPERYAVDATLACAPGETLALVGPSGSGKSTLLRCIAGLHRAAAGRIDCAGQTWLDTDAGIDRTPQQRSTGFVFQSYALFPHLSALENVVAAMSHRPAAGRAARARELLARVHLAGLESRMPAHLSGGQQQRVAVARALARDPQVLLLDEPFSAVDRVTRQRLDRELAELRRTLALPIVLVTHDLDEAALLADRMSILHRGRTLQTGTPLELMTRPVDALVARLVDMRNVFEARVIARAEGNRGLAWSAGEPRVRGARAVCGRCAGVLRDSAVRRAAAPARPAVARRARESGRGRRRRLPGAR